MHIIIKRREVEEVSSLLPWVWIVGRRKTGKSFMIKNFFNYDSYFFVTEDREIISEEGEMSLEEFYYYLKYNLGREFIVIDEFQRLPKKFQDLLHYTGIKGNLILISSALDYTKKLLSKNSPLLGLFAVYELKLIDERDIILELSKHLKDKKELVEAAVYLREPILIPRYKPPIREFLSLFYHSNNYLVEELIGEIFREEHKELTAIYKAILKAIASGKANSGEIAQELYKRSLLPSPNSAYIQRYLEVLVRIGLLERIEIFGKKRFLYRHLSPLFDLHFYLDAKYGYTETEIPENFIHEVIETKLPFHIEQFFEKLLAKMYGLKPIKILDPEIDIALTKFNKLYLVGEVKWRRELTSSEIKKIEEKFRKIKAKEKLLIVPDKTTLSKEPKGISTVDIDDFLNSLARN